MTNRNMKGLFKGLRYIGQIFDEENKNDEIHIGLPTDVKHVAHIGFDGPSDAAADSNPSWMRGFNPNLKPERLDSNGNNTENQDTKCASEDSKKVKKGKDQSGAPKSSRRRNLSDTTNNNSNESSSKPRHRRQNSKDSSECGINLSHHSDSEKKMRRKKHSTKDSEGKTRSKHASSSDVSDSGS